MDDQLTCRCGDKAALLDAASLSERIHVTPAYLVVCVGTGKRPRCPEGYLVSYLAIYLARGHV
jgi:hypothetical protein